ncbi:transcriptional regulator, TetR family [Andreprevotia lacus DSM 23236]|jgi:AcrR family transcriptional regulator|uniref:Transcriptional regulator, TetR family n=1 Tax=Andreprevotia lacus DSM 23236 TaxID=1121001 RepID=A0A1W1XDN9_9NEIS|nr:TetR/AcrR family transcriptional regulator [Andreprevotia lacus]SMC21768.1 transcriptional regulator, TetR family [Andreprevotia lacus DSM 23236]
MNDTSSKPRAPRIVVSASEASARILDAAESLFYREGARSVGVDAVVKEAGINKMSLYRQFSSKDELLRQYLLRRDEKFWAYFNASINKHPADAAAALRQFFIDLAARACQPDYRGCPFVNIAAEFADPAHFAREMVAHNKRDLLARLTALSVAAGAADPHALACGLALLIEGAYTASQTFGNASPVIAALPQVAGTMITQALVT